MKRIVLSLLAVSFTALFASELNVYQDKAVLSYVPARQVLGLVDVTSAMCGSEKVALRRVRTCDTADIACKRYEIIQTLREEAAAIGVQLRTLDALVASVRSDAIRPQAWLKEAKRLAKAYARLSQKQEALTFEIKEEETLLKRQTRASVPVAFVRTCQKTATLTFPAGAFSFAPRYEADIRGDTLDVKRFLEVTNKSGMDINATQGHFFYYRASEYIRLPRFRPIVVSDTPIFEESMETVSASRRAMKPTIAKRDVQTSAPVAMKSKSRTYSVQDIFLPSDGLPKRFLLEGYEAKAACETELHTYMTTQAFYVCRFTPKDEVENTRWKVSRHGNVLNENAVGRYEGKRYALYIEYIKTLQVTRKPYVPQKKEDGFFDTKVKKKSGHTLILTNTDTKPLRVHVFERIPVSATEKIEIRPIEPKGVENFTVDKEGKVGFFVLLKSRESKRIDVLYEIVHDKTIKAYRH